MTANYAGQYPNGDVPCNCCAMPIGKNSLGAQVGKCFDCSRDELRGVVNFANDHNAKEHGDNYAETHKLITAWMKGELDPGEYVLPSGKLQITDPYYDEETFDG